MKRQENKTFKSLTIYDVLYSVSPTEIRELNIEEISIYDNKLSIRYYYRNKITINNPAQTSHKSDREEIFVNYSKAYSRMVEMRNEMYKTLVHNSQKSIEKLDNFVDEYILNDKFK
jgi:hypothetical protein